MISRLRTLGCFSVFLALSLAGCGPDVVDHPPYHPTINIEYDDTVLQQAQALVDATQEQNKGEQLRVRLCTANDDQAFSHHSSYYDEQTTVTICTDIAHTSGLVWLWQLRIQPSQPSKVLGTIKFKTS